MPNPSPLRLVTEDNLKDEVLDSPVPVLLDFGTPWCGPCRALTPVLHRLAARAGDRIRVAYVSADECPSVAARFSVKGYPTVIAFRNGVERARHLGATDESTLLRMVEACS